MRVLAQFSGTGGPTGTSRHVEFRDLDEELRYLRNVVTRFRMVPVIRDKAMEIIRTARVTPRDAKNQALAIGEWVQNNIYYVHEFPERFQDPDVTLRTKAGDCDDSTTLVGAMLESVGIPAILVGMKFDGQYRHIFPSAKLVTGLLPLDTTHRYGGIYGENPISYTQARGKGVKIKLA